MNPVRPLYTTGVLLALPVCLLLPVPCSPAQKLASPSHSTNTAEQSACERQLNMIYGAIQEYRRWHDNGLPAKLSDLRPDFIYDPNILVCPVVRNRGGLRTWKKKFTELMPDAYTSYSYEFPPVPLDHHWWRGLPKKTWRQIKERQLEKIGDQVPIVRCHDHGPRLNLAIGGRIYESGTYWERNFVANEDELLLPAKLFPSSPAPRPLSPGDFPPRDPRANPRLLDLTAFYNATLTNSWQGFPGNSLSGLTPGIQEFHGVRFDVRGVIQFYGTEIPALFPRQVSGIPVQQKCSRVHFLHAVSWTYRQGSTNGSYLICYGDGQVRKVPIIYGRNVADWWCDSPQTNGLADAAVAWTGENEATKAYGKALCLYHAVWENPRRDVEIATIGFDDGAKEFLAGPFIVGITLE